MDRSKFSPDEFLENESFIRWVNQPTPESSRYWEEYIQLHPDRQKDIDQARSFITAVNKMENETPSTAQSAEMWRNIQAGMQENKTVLRMHKTWLVAASVLLIVVSSAIFFIIRNRQEAIQHTVANAPFLERPVKLITIRNDLRQSKKVTLADGSTVLLEGNSLLSYHSDFNSSNREVLLEGEAFFEVTKSDKPFLIYSKDVITKVLGTSFRIKALPGDKQVNVSVRTGKVWVNVPKKTGRLEQPEGVVITPNYQVTYSPDDESLEVSLVDQPVQLKPLEKEMLVFEDKPMGEVLQALSTMYGVEIVYDTAVLNNCLITTTLTNEALNDQLSLVCSAVKAAYTEKNGKIIISGGECK
jgi:ferric-dicitrate binding protein FerR (iron transport regulator)